MACSDESTEIYYLTLQEFFCVFWPLPLNNTNQRRTGINQWEFVTASLQTPIVHNVLSVHKANSSSERLPAVQTYSALCLSSLRECLQQQTDVDSCRRPPDSALWMIKSCCRDHLPSRWRHTLDISNTLALAVHQGSLCLLVTEWLVWNSNGGDTRLEHHIQQQGGNQRTACYHISPLMTSNLKHLSGLSGRIGDTSPL